MLQNNLIFYLFSLSGLVMGVIAFIMSTVLLIYGRTVLHRVLALFNLAICIWGIGAYCIGQQHDPSSAIIAWRASFLGVIFISVFFYHGMCLFVEIKRSKPIIFAYVQGIIFLILNLTNLYISKVFYLNNSIYYIKATGFLFTLSFIFWLFFVIAGFIEVLVHLKSFVGIKKTQAAYFLFSFGTGFLGGVTNFFPMFGIKILPFGNITIPIYCLLVTYAMLKFRVIDFKIAITRVGIFIITCVLVLGFPVYVYYNVNTFLALIAAIVLGFSGPLLFGNLRKEVENKILEEQKRYQRVLETTSENLNKFKTIEEVIRKYLHYFI